MTGFGRGESASESRSFIVELKSLNSKQLDLMARMPQDVRELEVELRNKVLEHLERGKVELNVSETILKGGNGAGFNSRVLNDYISQIKNFSSETGIPEPHDWYSVLLRMPDVMIAQPINFGECDKDALYEAFGNAVKALDNFRIVEGKKLYKFFVDKILRLYELLTEVEPYDAERVPKIKARMEEQLRKLDSIEYDRGLLEQELIFYIEKLDVTEEKTRLRAHLQYFLDTMGGENDYSEKGQGKKLGFIAQEIGREINTLGSKSNDAGMQQIVVKMKDELEQIKEQVLNVL